MFRLFAAAALTGALTPVQTAANARLRQNAGDVAAVTLISFTVSAALLLAAEAAVGLSPLPSAGELAAAPWWSWTGGVVALFTIAASIQLFKTLGQLQASLLPMLGQVLFSLVIDHFGLFGAARAAITPVRAFAAALVTAGAIAAAAAPYLKGGARNGGGRSPSALPWQAAGVAAGYMTATIGAIYGTLGTALGSAVRAASSSFVIAVCAAALFCAATGRLRNVRAAFCGGPWWMRLGGFCGALAVCGNSWLIPRIGAGAFFMSLIFGQMSLSLCMELRGWLGAPRRRVSAPQLAGVAAMLLGVALLLL